MAVDFPTPAAPAPPLSPDQRRRAWIDLLLVDHGFLREVYLHKHRVTDELWRSAQPAPRHLEQAAREGFKTVLNLRGARPTDGVYLLERETCQRAGLKLVDFPIRSRSALYRPTLLAALDLWDTLEYPVLMHCKSGADRTGFMATMYLWQRTGMPLRQAMDQLSLRFGHVRQAKTGIIDFLYETYLAAEAETGIGFREWIETVYDHEALNAAFRENWFASVLVNRILRRE